MLDRYRCPHCRYSSNNVELATGHITRHSQQVAAAKERAKAKRKAKRDGKV